jgi:hypothetical protein
MDLHPARRLARPEDPLKAMPSSLDFTEADLRALAARGIAHEEAARQLRLLREQPRPIRLERPCTIGDGIVTLKESDYKGLLALADTAAHEGRVTKFVPASGAATRMFKDLIALHASRQRASETPTGRTFLDHLDRFPFSEELRRRANIVGAVSTESEERRLLATLLYDMRYAELPKALVAFHRIHKVRTAFEEQVLEATGYTRTSEGVARSHFTVAPEFRHEFERALRTVSASVADETGVRVAVTFSEQQPDTDTLAIAPGGEPFRANDGSLLFRPAGHGALLSNLNALNGDLVVIKNIDNVVPYERSQEVIEWKRLLVGYAVTLQREHGERPLRVCGVVQNQGEPGGAPFWVTDGDGRCSAQIVEASQVDNDDAGQRRIFESSTHFNPVDIVCGLRAHDGRQYDLQRFVDPGAVFLSRKSHESRELIALERPGLWNGAMAHWKTVFVEVPASTFAPVKTVFDLLRPQHQSL